MLGAGDPLNPQTRMHNRIANFVAFAIRAGARLGIYYVLEQPLSSIMFKYLPVATALADTGAARVHLNLGDFGAETAKPLCLMGAAPWLPDLRAEGRRRSATVLPMLQGTLAVRSHEGQVTGRTAALTESAAYPEPFCEEVARLHRQLVNQEQRQKVEVLVCISLLSRRLRCSHIAHAVPQYLYR
jgi:hypothetical protein